MYHYGGPGDQQAVNRMKAEHAYMDLRAGAAFKAGGCDLRVTHVQQLGDALILQGAVKNDTSSLTYVRRFTFELNESPDRQMVWLRAHRSTPEYHYGPGFNSHNVTTAEIPLLKPGQTGSFIAVWNHQVDTISAEPLSDLVVIPDCPPE